MTLVDLPDFSLKSFSACLAASCASCTSFDLTVTVTLGSMSCSKPCCKRIRRERDPSQYEMAQGAYCERVDDVGHTWRMSWLKSFLYFS